MMDVVYMILAPLIFSACSNGACTDKGTENILVVGQSNIDNRVPDFLYRPKNDVRVLHEGEFVTKDVQGEYINIAFDKLIDEGYATRINYVNVAVGGSSSESWSQNGINYHRVAELSHIPFKTILYHQGEHGTAYNVSREEYRDNLQSFVDGVTGIFPNVKIYVSIVSYRDYGETSSEITNAQYDIINSNSNVYLGVSTDDITDRIDGTHFSIDGAKEASNRWVEILK